MYYFKNERSELRLTNGFCPHCREVLSDDTYVENRGEHFGTPVSETIYQKVCPNCGIIEN